MTAVDVRTPFDNEAELAVLGAMLIENECIPAVARVVRSCDFREQAHRILFDAMEMLDARGSVADPVTIGAELGVGALRDAGGMAYLAELLDVVPTAANVEHHARIVREMSARREVIRLATNGDMVSLAAAVTRIGEHHGARQLTAPMAFADLLNVPDPEERDLANGAIPADANILLGAYPKTHKTNFVLELAIALVSATLFLGRFAVPRVHRVGLVLMEDAQHRVRRRLERMCRAHGVDAADLADRLHIWFRPPIRLADAGCVADLKAYAADLELDLLCIDNWSHVSTGDSNDADVVTQQLSAFASVREAHPGMSVLLVQHARKQGPDKGAERLTDTIRNSSAFGAWYDCGIVLSRQDEQSPVTVRMELRDRPAPAAFSFTVEDEYPGDDSRAPSGYLRMLASDKSAALIKQETDALRYIEPVRDFLQLNPGASKAALKKNVVGDNLLVEAAFDLLCARGEAGYTDPPKKGVAGKCFLKTGNLADLAATSLDSDVKGNLADLAADPRRGQLGSEPPAAAGEFPWDDPDPMAWPDEHDDGPEVAA